MSFNRSRVVLPTKYKESENRMIPGLLFSTHLSLYLFTFSPFYL